jgi:hypothetical protein
MDQKQSHEETLILIIDIAVSVGIAVALRYILPVLFDLKQDGELIGSFGGRPEPVPGRGSSLDGVAETLIGPLIALVYFYFARQRHKPL